MKERRHRYNTAVSGRRRPGFPKFGHVDTWLVDLLQQLVLKNHGGLLYPEWSNTSDFIDTREQFGTVPIHSDALDDKVRAIKVVPCACRGAEKKTCKCKCKLTPDQAYMCTRMGTKLPFLPVDGEHECKLFAELVLEISGTPDFDAMAIRWCDLVDGVKIWPKLPVYLRVHFASFARNQRVKKSVLY